MMLVIEERSREAKSLRAIEPSESREGKDDDLGEGDAGNELEDVCGE